MVDSATSSIPLRSATWRKLFCHKEKLNRHAPQRGGYFLCRHAMEKVTSLVKEAVDERRENPLEFVRS